MRILIDLQSLQSESRHRGIGRYSLALTEAISRNRGQHEIFVLLNNKFPRSIDAVKDLLKDFIPNNHFILFNTQNQVSTDDARYSWRNRSSEILRENLINNLQPDVLLISSLFEGAADAAITSVGHLPSEVTTAVVLYDLIPLIYPETYLTSNSYREWYFEKIESLKRADILLSISKSARLEAIEKLSLDRNSVFNISSAVDARFTKLNLEKNEVNKLKSRFKIKNNFLMHVGVLESRKNFENLIKAFGQISAEIRAGFQLILVCKISDAQRIQFGDLVASTGLSKDDVVFAGSVSDQDLVSLYSECYLFVFPSFHEGFGLPVLEAMCCGAAVIASNSSSIPEIIQRPDALFDPNSVSNIAEFIERALTDIVFWNSLKENSKIQSERFSWDAVAKSAIAELEKAFLKRTKNCLPIDEFRLADEIISVKSEANPTLQDLVEVSSFIEKNEIAANQTSALADFSGKFNWRIEGPFDSTYSLALLNRETALSLNEYGHNVILHSPDYKVKLDYLDRNKSIASMHERVVDFPQENTDVLSRNNYPPVVDDMKGNFNLLHHYAWEETGYPHAWVDKFNSHLNGISCLASHVEKILIDNGVSVQMSTTGCGVDHWERIEPDPAYGVTAKNFRFLHVSSCFPRKGVDLLLDAYGKTFTSNDNVSLIIKTFDNIHNNIRDLLEERRAINSKFPEVILIFGDISDSQLKALYGQCHVLVAPSCAEGFGLPMAEALLTGLPVITTAWGGQLDFCNKNNSWLVDYKFAKAKSHFNIFYSAWAEVDIGALSNALREAFLSPLQHLKDKAFAGREFLLQNYKWSDTAYRLIDSATKWRGSSNANVEPIIGWFTTWNTKCGIATYSNHLIENIQNENLTIFSPVSIGLIQPDSVQCVRYNPNGGILELGPQILKRKINTIVIQFNYGLYNFEDLSTFILEQERSGVIVIFVMHATGELDSNIKLLPALLKCHRILVHSIADLNRLKSHGLIENVAMFPHGALSVPDEVVNSSVTDFPLIASYGFCLPHKGLAELVESIAILRDKGKNVRLRLVNSEYPAEVSAKLVVELKKLIVSLNLSDLVEMHSDFLDDETSLRLLGEANLIVYPYQHTGESASGAVRYGLATKRPVAVTPLKIFDDIGDSAFRFSGTSSLDIADGISDVLSNLQENNDRAKHVSSIAKSWRDQHDYVNISRRMINICRALLLKNPKKKYFYTGSSRRFSSDVGRIDGRKIYTTNRAGRLMFGPTLALASGNYQIALFGNSVGNGFIGARIRIATNKGCNNIADAYFSESSENDRIFNMEFTISSPVIDLDIEVSVEDSSDFCISQLIISSV